MFYDDEVDGFDGTSGYYDSENSGKKGGFLGKLFSKLGKKSEVEVGFKMGTVEGSSYDNGRADDKPAENEDDEVKDVTGTIGKNLTYRLVGEWDRLTLTISGQGPMEDFKEDHTPWEEDSYYIKKIIVEDGVTSIGNHAFDGCFRVKNIELPNTITRIGKDAFNSCQVVRKLVIPDSVTVIEENAFFNCDDLEEITVPRSVKKLKKDVFSCLENLEILKIEADIDYIPEGLVWDNPSLKELWLPAVSKMHNLGIGECPELTDIYYAGTKKQWDKLGFGEEDDEFKDVTIHFNA